MKPTKEQKTARKKVEDFIKKWKATLFLDQWTFKVGFMTQDDNEHGTLADIEAKHEYFSATLRIFPCFWKLTTEEQENTIVHELIHAVISPVASAYEDMMDGNMISQTSFAKLNEGVTQHITNILLAKQA